MHLGNTTVTPTCAACGLALATAGWGAGLALARSAKRPEPMKFALGTGLVFALQAMNMTVLPGTASGHLIGGVLLAHWFGVIWGLGAITLVLALQGILFADGGFLSFGLNVLNMGVIPCLLVYPAVRWAVGRSRASLALAAWLSVMAASIACTIQIDFALIGTMLGVHALIGLIEAVVTVGAVVLVENLPQRMARPQVGIVAVLALAVAAVFGASPYADGLEYSLQRHGITEIGSSIAMSLEHVQGVFAVFPDYPHFSVVLGTGLLLAIAWGIARLARSPQGGALRD